MNGENETEVKQTPNEQSEKTKKIIENAINQIEGDPEFLIKALDTVKERDEKINQSLGDLSNRIALSHDILKGQHAAIIEQQQEINNRLDRIEIEIAVIRDILVKSASAKGLEPQPETAEQPADEKPEQSDKKEQPNGSGL